MAVKPKYTIFLLSYIVSMVNDNKRREYKNGETQISSFNRFEILYCLY